MPPDPQWPDPPRTFEEGCLEKETVKGLLGSHRIIRVSAKTRFDQVKACVLIPAGSDGLVLLFLNNGKCS